MNTVIIVLLSVAIVACIALAILSAFASTAAASTLYSTATLIFGAILLAMLAVFLYGLVPVDPEF